MIEDGVTGFIVEDVQGAVGALHRIDSLSRDAIRARFDTRFSAKAMARRYVETYESLCTAAKQPALRRVASA